MKVYTRTIDQVFDGNRRYVVPLFQRQYVWSMERQWQPLWEDIQAQTELVAKGESEDRPPHFLGAIVLSSLPFHNDEIKAQQVIDGQQRLTTFQLFLAAFRDVCRSFDPLRADTLAKLCLNDGPMEIPATERFKVWPTGADQPQFKDAIDCGSLEAVIKKYPAPPPAKAKTKKDAVARGALPRMLEAYEFFFTALREYVGVGEEQVRRAKNIHSALRQRLQLVSIELEGNDDPQVIFETLNDRGEKLLPSDLLRNFLFMRADRAKENSAELYASFWQHFDEEPEDATQPNAEKFWKTEIVQGRLTRARIDIFMQQFLAMHSGVEPNISTLFQEYRKWAGPKIPGRYPTVKAELQDLRRYSSKFKELVRPNLDTRIGLAAARIRTLDTTTVYPLLLSLLGDDKLPTTERDGIVADLESFLVRRAVCGKTKKGYNHLFLQMLRRFNDETSRTRASFAKILLALEGDSVEFPSDDEFRAAWVTGPLYRTVKAAGVELLLRAINRELVNEKNGGLLPTQKLTVEHVMPQKWEAYWPLNAALSDAEAEAAEERREARVHTVGNLTLVTQALNSTVSNGPYLAKKQEFVVHAGLWINGYFQNINEWNEDTIEARSRALFAYALKIWPLPVAASPAASSPASH